MSHHSFRYATYRRALQSQIDAAVVDERSGFLFDVYHFNVCTLVELAYEDACRKAHVPYSPPAWPGPIPVGSDGFPVDCREAVGG